MEPWVGAGGFAEGIFIDIESTINNTSRCTIEAALGRYEVLRLVRSWINHILASQAITASKGETRMILGCPQPRLLSPLLWKLVVDD